MMRWIGTFVLCLFAGLAIAQSDEETDQYVELMRADVRAQKVQLITKAMEFGTEESAAFWPVYNKYQAEFNKLGDERLALIKDYAANIDTLDDAKALDLAERAMTLDEKRIALLKQYVPEFKKVLSGKRVARLVQVENQINRLIDLQIASQIPLVP